MNQKQQILEDERANTFCEMRNFSPNDQALRAAGFRIHARPSNGPVVWEKDGKLYEQDDAMKEIG